MKLVSCIVCRHQLSSEADHCPHCGQPMPKYEPYEKQTDPWGVQWLVALAIIVIALIYYADLW